MRRHKPIASDFVTVIGCLKWRVNIARLSDDDHGFERCRFHPKFAVSGIAITHSQSRFLKSSKNSSRISAMLIRLFPKTARSPHENAETDIAEGKKQIRMFHCRS
jgi:hypothetical protein